MQLRRAIIQSSIAQNFKTNRTDSFSKKNFLKIFLNEKENKNPLKCTNIKKISKIL